DEVGVVQPILRRAGVGVLDLDEECRVVRRLLLQRARQRGRTALDRFGRPVVTAARASGEQKSSCRAGGHESQSHEKQHAVRPKTGDRDPRYSATPRIETVTDLPASSDSRVPGFLLVVTGALGLLAALVLSVDKVQQL